MKNKFGLFSLSLLAISCNNKDNKTEESVKLTNTTITDSRSNDNGKDKVKRLRFEDFKNSKWIIGEKGLNGGKPDTIIFDNPNKLKYISDETGEETCNYSFSKDTLIYTSYSTEFDMESDNEIKYEIISRLIFKNCPVLK